MLISTDNISLYYHSIGSLSALKFDFKGDFDLQTCILANKVWERELEVKPNQKQVIIWDCTLMSGIDVKAKAEWMNQLALMTKNIDQLIIISESNFLSENIESSLKHLGFKSVTYSTFSDFKERYIYTSI